MVKTIFICNLTVYIKPDYFALENAFYKTIILTSEIIYELPRPPQISSSIFLIKIICKKVFFCSFPKSKQDQVLTISKDKNNKYTI